MDSNLLDDKPHEDIRLLRLAIGFVCERRSLELGWPDSGAAKPPSLGTVFAVDRDVVVTARHVVAPGSPRTLADLVVGFETGRTYEFTVEHAGTELVYLRLSQSVPGDVALVELTDELPAMGRRWFSLGYPSNRTRVDGLNGVVAAARLPLGESEVTWLQCSNTGKDLRGFSGAPVLLDDTSGVRSSFGIVVKAFADPDDPELGDSGNVLAYHLTQDWGRLPLCATEAPSDSQVFLQRPGDVPEWTSSQYLKDAWEYASQWRTSRRGLRRPVARPRQQH